jgi:hypothetical protein
LIGVLGGMIGLGGAEFRLPLLIGVFGFIALQAVIVNKAMSLIVVLTALPARLMAVPLTDVTSEWEVVLNLLSGSLVGAWLGCDLGDQDAVSDAPQGSRGAPGGDRGGSGRVTSRSGQDYGPSNGCAVDRRAGCGESDRDRCRVDVCGRR